MYNECVGTGKNIYLAMEFSFKLASVMNFFTSAESRGFMVQSFKFFQKKILIIN